MLQKQETRTLKEKSLFSSSSQCLPACLPPSELSHLCAYNLNDRLELGRLKWVSPQSYYLPLLTLDT